MERSLIREKDTGVPSARLSLNDLKQMPFCCIGVLQIYFSVQPKKGKQGQSYEIPILGESPIKQSQIKYCSGTAFLISDRFAVTCAHNFFVEGEINAINFYSSPYDKLGQPIRVLDRWIPKQYKYEDKHIQWDIALIQLQKSVKRDGYLPLLFNFSSTSLELEISGYQGIKQQTNLLKGYYPQRFASQMYSKFYAEIIGSEVAHLNSTEPGNSGSPLFIEIGKKKYVIGIHCAGDKNIICNYGLLFRQQNMSFILSCSAKLADTVNSKGIYRYLNEDIRPYSLSRFHNELYLLAANEWDNSLENRKFYLLYEMNSIAKLSQKRQNWQISVKYPIPDTGRYYYKIRLEPDIGNNIFGIITKGRKREKVSGRGGNEGSIGYINYNGNTWLMENLYPSDTEENIKRNKKGKPVPYLQKGSVVTLYCDMDRKIIHWVCNEKQLATTELTAPYLSDPLYLFAVCSYEGDKVILLN